MILVIGNTVLHIWPQSFTDMALHLLYFLLLVQLLLGSLLFATLCWKKAWSPLVRGPFKARYKHPPFPAYDDIDDHHSDCRCTWCKIIARGSF